MRSTILLLSVLFIGCSSDPEPAADVSGDVQTSTDVGQADATTDVPSSEDALVSTDTAETDTASYDNPAYFPGVELEADTTKHLVGLTEPVRVIQDSFGVPHVYGSTLDDLLFAQGYITASKRLFQMHTLRLAASGRLGELLGPGSVSGDVLLRTLKLRDTAERMATRTKELYPDLYQVLERYAEGVNSFIARMNAGDEPKPLEVIVFQSELAPWTPADTLTIVRLQTWDLGFGGVFSEDELLERILALQKTFDGSPREGIEADVYDFTPPAQTPTVAGKNGVVEASPTNFKKIIENPFFQKFGIDMWANHAKMSRETLDYPHRMFRSEDFGSNNWVVSGDHTKSGRPMVANDPHLALRNPAIFFQVHLSDKLAGGDFEVSGVNFAGSPGIVLGHNDHAAWGATVFYSDVTDIYAEDVTADGKGVLFNGEVVPFEVRKETFMYILPGDATCEQALGGWVNELDPQVKKLDGATCELTVTVKDVPHHGPVIPWSETTDKDGNPACMTWKWTGFEATDELKAIWGLNLMKSVDDFKAALDHFDVGAQNWVYGDKDGNIAWYPSHQLPVRPNKDFPPFLPMPGDGSAEWDGFVDRALLPQSFNPAEGFLVTANADPIGVTYDNDTFNDGPYLGHTWAPGFRMERSHELVKAAVDAGQVTPAKLSEIQGDHRSNSGMRVTPHLLASIEAAVSGADPQAQAEMNDSIVAAKSYLEAWEGHGYAAASGVGEPADSAAAQASIATSILNATLVHLFPIVLGDEGVADIQDGFKIRLLLRMLESPAKMATYDEASEESLLWDDVKTLDVVETRHQMLIRSLSEGLAFLANPEKVGVAQAGGFGSDDMSTWRWGALHTVTLSHNVAVNYNIPSPAQFPDGYPRAGDNFCVDASHPGLGDTSFTFGGGPSLRNVYELTDVISQWAIIPGGQDESPSGDHYQDQMALWVKNEAPLRAFKVEDVLDDRALIMDFRPSP
jgi:penicillin G amidase